MERIDTARTLVKKSSNSEEVVLEIMARFGVSRRQAYRYMKEAQKKRKAPVPERKIVFTVKLPESLASLVRHVADSTGESLSSLVTQALKTFLRRRGYGRKAP
jgi:hypothetical protein